MFKFDLEDYAKSFCDWPTKFRAENLGYKFKENPDGTVTIFNANNLQTGFSTIETCCEKSGYEFDIENRKCLWKSTECELDDFKLIINPQGNTSALFDIDENETCCLDVSFDYKFKFDCNVLEEAINGTSIEVQVNTEKIIELEEEITKIDIQIYNIRGRIASLSNVPFVIECTDTFLFTEGTVFKPLSWGSWSKTRTDWSNLYSRTPKSSWTDNIPPNAYSIPYYTSSQTNKFCLTEAGLSVWNSILGARYETWFNSNGTNTTIYDCTDVNNFQREASISSEELYTPNCTYTIYDKSRAQEQIAELEARLKRLVETKEKITEEIKYLESETQTIFLGGTCNSVIEFFENLNVSFTIERLNTTTNRLETVYEESIFSIGEGNFWDYISNASGSTGIIISGSSGVMPTLNQGNYSPLPPFATSDKFNTTTFSDCLQFRKQIVEEVYNIIPADERERVSVDRKIFNDALSDWWQSCWLSYSNKVCDVELIQSLKGEKVNMSIKISNACADFSVLLDRVKMTKSCTKVDNVETFISEPPKFEFTRIIDNKKSWIANTSRDDRFYDLKYRPAEYNTNHHKLVINTKEVDLSLDPARAVEQDVWCYVNSNPGILGCKTGNTYSCPTGFDLTPGLDNCVAYNVTGATITGTMYSATTGDLNSAYSSSGTLFYKEGLNEVLPYNLQGTDATLKDGTGGTISFDQQVNTGTLWYANGSSANGRLNNCGIWTTLGSGLPFQEWFGFSQCIDITSAGTYSIGLAADNRTRFRIDGTEIYTSENLTTNSNRDLIYWRVFEVQLTSGKHIVEMEGYNYGSDASFGAEIYQAPISQLTGMTSESELSAVTVFTTADLRTGTPLIPLGETNGYSCPTGYALDTCSGGTAYTCTQIIYTGITIENDCLCCPGQPLLISPVATDGTISLPSTYKYNEDDYTEAAWLALKKYTCEVFVKATYYIAYEIDSNGETYRFQEYETVNGCGPIYGMQGDTSVTQDINGYIIALENDGTIGVYEWEKLTGETATYENISNIICCGYVEDMFRTMEIVLHQGTSVYPTVSTDPNTGLCVYSRCGDRCSDLSGKVTTDLVEVDSVEEFTNTISSELIDVKNRQTISSYGTLRMLYDRYNFNSLNFSSNKSSQYDYFDMDNFGQAVGNYWVGLIEQVVPATSIWDSTYVYRNTVFDEQKFKYKNNNLYYKDESSKYPFDNLTNDSNVEVIVTELSMDSSGNTTTSTPITYNGVWDMQWTCGPEFIGSITTPNG